MCFIPTKVMTVHVLNLQSVRYDYFQPYFDRRFMWRKSFAHLPPPLIPKLQPIPTFSPRFIVWYESTVHMIILLMCASWTAAIHTEQDETYAI